MEEQKQTRNEIDWVWIKSKVDYFAKLYCVSRNVKNAKLEAEEIASETYLYLLKNPKDLNKLSLPILDSSPSEEDLQRLKAEENKCGAYLKKIIRSIAYRINAKQELVTPTEKCDSSYHRRYTIYNKLKKISETYSIPLSPSNAYKFYAVDSSVASLFLIEKVLLSQAPKKISLDSFASSEDNGWVSKRKAITDTTSDTKDGWDTDD